MPVPTWTAGQVLAAADVDSWMVPRAGYKTSDTARTSASQVADADLTVTPDISAVYRVDAELFYKSTSTGGQFDWTWTIPAGSAAGLYCAIYTGSGGTGLIEANGWTDAAHSAGVAVAGTVYSVTIHGLLSVASTSGAFTLNWGCHGAGPTVTLTARSSLVLNRIG